MDEHTHNANTIDAAKNHKAVKLFLIILLFLVSLAGIAYSAYAWNQNTNQRAALNDKDAQIKQLNNQVALLKTTNSATTAAPVSNVNTIAIRELGVSITVPDSIKDLTYSYAPIVNENGKFETVYFSTKTLTDQYAGASKSANTCSSSSATPPLGALEKWTGTYNSANPYQRLAKQLNGYYITYDSPQVPCMTNVPSGANPIGVDLNAFTNSFSTIKQL